MRKFVGLVAALGLVLGDAQPARALVQSLVAVTSMDLYIGSLAAIPVAWSGLGSANVTATDVTGLTAGIFNFSGTVPVTDPTVFPIAGVSVVGATNGAGNFYGVDTATGGGLMAVMGTANVCMFAPCATTPANVTVPFTAGGVNGIGLGGAPVTAFGFVNVTVVGNAWTTGTAAIGTVSMNGSPLSGNSVTLVTPTFLSSSIAASPIIPTFVKMTLTFVPEPGTLLLVASVAVGLALAGRKRISE